MNKMTNFSNQPVLFCALIQTVTETKHWGYYGKIPKYSDTRKIPVIILKFEQDGFIVW